MKRRGSEEGKVGTFWISNKNTAVNFSFKKVAEARKMAWLSVRILKQNLSLQVERKIINFRTHDDPFLFFFQFPETKAILDLFPSAEHRTLIAIGWCPVMADLKGRGFLQSSTIHRGSSSLQLQYLSKTCFKDEFQNSNKTSPCSSVLIYILIHTRYGLLVSADLATVLKILFLECKNPDNQLMASK